jgi:hypothetical protein
MNEAMRKRQHTSSSSSYRDTYRRRQRWVKERPERNKNNIKK